MKSGFTVGAVWRTAVRGDHPAEARTSGSERCRFTLVELLIIILIIGILSILVLPSLSSSRENSRRIACRYNLMLLGSALRVYAGDTDGVYPRGDNAAGLADLQKRGYVSDTNLFLCPSTLTEQAEEELTNAHLDYIYRGGLTVADCGSSTGLACDRIKTPNHDNFGNVLFGDGHVIAFEGQDWATRNKCHNAGEWPLDPH